MSCDNVQELIPSLLDGRMTAGEERNALAHLGSCRTCNSEYQSLQSLRGALQNMNRPVMPRGLTERLRVLASHERQRQARRANLRAFFHYWYERLWLAFDNMARPVALPFAGGFLSALLMFGAVMPNLAFPSNFRNDVPTMISTEPDGEIVDWMPDRQHYYPQLVPVTAEVSSDATAVLLLIDPQGKVADYMSTQGPVTKEMKSIILWSTFTPATMFGYPTWGYKLVLFPRTPSQRS